MQVFGIVLAGGPQQQISTIRDALRGQLKVEEFGETFGSAPVLTIPYIFEPSLCRELIEYYEQAGAEPDFFTVEEDGHAVGKVDSGREVRRAALLRDSVLAGRIRDCFIQRVFPQIRRAYQFEARHLEQYRVACYDAKEDGYFERQWDNATTTAGIAHRRFSATVNLNSEQYEGGELQFPEFGTRKFRPPSGSALIFSGSLLHQSLPVRRGTRYAFLSFIYDEAGIRIQAEEANRAAELSDQNASPTRETPDPS
jgi:predicted 2-oxoglutarate/Fe(II)-dependent dioxygenase YbiX